MEFTQQVPEPATFSNGVGHGLVLSFSARPRDCGLPFGRPRDQRIAEEDTVAGGRSPCIRAASLVRVRIRFQRGRWRSRDGDAVVNGAPEITQNPFDKVPVGISRRMHM